MWSNPTRGSRRGIVHLCLCQNFFTKVFTQASGGIHIHFLPAEKPRKFLFHVVQVEQSHPGAWLELNQHIDIAFGCEVVAQHRAEERELANMMALTEGRQLLPRNSDFCS